MPAIAVLKSDGVFLAHASVNHLATIATLRILVYMHVGIQGKLPLWTRYPQRLNSNFLAAMEYPKNTSGRIE